MTFSAGERVPNRTLRAVRLALRMSQSEFAAAVRNAGQAMGEPNTCNKRLVQKWESGEHAACRPNYRRALQSVTRTPYEHLGFSGMVNQLLPTDRSTSPVVGPKPFALPAAGVAQCADRMRYALESPEQADTKTVALAQVSTAQLFDLEPHCPARLLAPAVHRHANEIAAILAGTRHDQLRRRLAATGGACLALAGWLAFDEGRAAAAAYYFDSAMAAARYAPDGQLTACVLTYQSYLAEDAGDSVGAW